MEFTREFILYKLGDRIKEYRYDIAGLTLEELSYRSGVSRNTINLIENGKIDPRITTIRKICNAMGLSAAEFFDFSMFPCIEYRF
ncbi:helix-turn-helix domain-containing protein [Flavobacterium hauense]